MREPAHPRTVRRCAGRTAAQRPAGGLSGSTKETTTRVSPPAYLAAFEIWRPLRTGGKGLWHKGLLNDERILMSPPASSMASFVNRRTVSGEDFLSYFRRYNRNSSTFAYVCAASF